MTYTMNFTDGSTTIAVGPNLDYRLKYAGWAPKRAQRRLSAMGGSSPYEDVDENPIDLIITGDSPAIALANYEALSDLMDQAESWGPPHRQNVDAVKMEFLKDGSELANPVSSVIYRAIGGPRMLEVREDFTDQKNIHVTLEFMRRGQFLGTTETRTSAATSGNPAIAIISSAFTTDANILMPADVVFQAEDLSYAGGTYPTFCLITNDSDKITWRDSNDYTGSLFGWGSQAVGGSSGGTVLESDPTITSFGAQVAEFLPNGTFPSGSGLYHMFAMLENRSNTHTHQFKMGMTIASGIGESIEITIPVLSGPKLYFIGSRALPDAVTKYNVQAHIDSTGGAGHELWIDYSAILYVDDNAHVIQLSYAPWFHDDNLAIRHRLDSHDRPVVQQESSVGTPGVWPGYEGNAAIHTSGNSLAVLLMSHRSTDADYVLEDSSDTEVDYTLSATRTLAYLTPP